MSKQIQNPNDKLDYLTVFKYCPKCGSSMAPKTHDEQVMPTCQDEKCGFIYWQCSRPCVVTIIQNNDGHVLFTERNIEPEKGKLDLPGGFIMLGEDPEAAAIRETKEEVGVDVEIEELVGFANDLYFYQGVWERTLTPGYRARIVSGEPRVTDKREIASIEWVDPNNFDSEQLAFTCNEKFLRMVLGI